MPYMDPNLCSWHPILRSVQTHWLWADKPFAKGQAWIDMILLANYSPEKRLVSGVLIDVDEGQLVWPKYVLAERWGWSKDKVSRFFDLLESDGMIAVQAIRELEKTGKRFCVVTLLNYKELRILAKGPQEINGKETGNKREINGKETGNGQVVTKELKNKISPPNGGTPPGGNPLDGDHEADTKKRKHAFEKSPFYPFEIFRRSLPEWSEAKCLHYFNRAAGYSAANGGRYLNWRAAVKNWDRDRPFADPGLPPIKAQALDDYKLDSEWETADG